MNVTLYVPEDLGKRMEAAKDKLNLSQLFQNAVETELLALADVAGSGLAKAKEKSDQYWFSLGKAHGMTDALKANEYDLVVQTVDLLKDEQYHDLERGIQQMGSREGPRLANAVCELWGWSHYDFFDGDSVVNEDAYVIGYVYGMWEALARLNAQE